MPEHCRSRLTIAKVFGSGTIGTDAAGPVSTVITRLINGYVDLGHRVTLVDAPATRRRTLLRQSVVVEEMRPNVGRLASVPLIGNRLAALVSAWQRARHLATLHQQHAFDIVHVHDSFDALAIGTVCRIPVILTAHNLNWTLVPRLHRSPAGVINRRLDRAAVAAAKHVVVLNQQTRRALPNRNVSVIPNGVDLGDWPALDRAAARQRLGIPLDEFRVTYLGRIAPEKGTHIFVRAVGRAKATIPLVADAIGSPSGKFGASDEITQYAAMVQAEGSGVQFHGFIHRDDPQFRLRLAAADAVVIPSITEPFGLVVLEALACGAWVIGSDTGGIRDILEHHVGELVPPGNVDALSRAITARYERTQTGACAPNARNRARDFHWDRIVGCYIDTLNQSIAEATQ